MLAQQHLFLNGKWSRRGDVGCSAAQLGLVFASPALIARADVWAYLRDQLPNARIVACSTAGEIAGISVHDDSLVCTSVTFDSSRVDIASAIVNDATDSQALGELLSARLHAEDLTHVLVLSDGIHVNGSKLVSGMVNALPPNVAVTGGLAGDGARFEETVVCVDAYEPRPQVVAIGFYGRKLLVGYGCVGGWDSFGIERCITKSEGNVVWQLDGEPVLDLYKRYLGAHASKLPASGLLFPLAIRPSGRESPAVVRTILATDEATKTLTFAGDMPVGYRARLMKANVERLIDGAQDAGATSRRALGDTMPFLAILISCIGRKLVLKQRVEEEVEAVDRALGGQTVITGFYSYGELSPSASSTACELHNQTMTVTTLAEI